MRIFKQLQRRIVWVLVAIVVTSCASESAPRPKEFLDDRTGATVTVAREPLLFDLERSLSKSNDSGFVSLTAASVDHSGEFQLYFVGYIWSLDYAHSDAAVDGTIHLLADGTEILLKPLAQFPGDLQDRKKLHAPAAGHFQQFAYSVTVELLDLIAASHDLSLRAPPAEVAGGAPSAVAGAAEDRYELWADSRGALRSFVQAVRPQFPAATP